mgnify:CR=1 FL=1
MFFNARYISTTSFPEHCACYHYNYFLYRLMAMEESLNAVMKQKGKLPLNSTALRSLCVAKFPDDDGLVYECDLSHGHVWP